MKDIGLGIFDAYTVVIVLIALVLSQVLFGYPIPLDTSNTIQFFIGLVLFTGYLYAGRSLIRFPIAAIVSLVFVKKSLRHTQTSFLDVLRHSPLLLGEWFLFIQDFPNEINKRREDINLFIRYLIAVVDRLGLILITFLTTLLQFKWYFQSIAIVGLIIMIILYILKGNFVGVLSDDLIKNPETENDKDEMPSAYSTKSRDEKIRARTIAIQNSMEQAGAATQPSHRDTISGEVDPTKNTFG